MGDLTSARIDLHTNIDPEDIVEAFGGDDNRVFLFIMAMLEDDRVGIEVRERLLEELQSPPMPGVGET